MTEMTSELRYDEAVTNKKATVTVTATPLSAAPWVSFAMDANYPNKGGKQDGDELDFNARAGPFELRFDLDDETDLDLAFYPNVADAMWVAVGSACPAQAGDGNGAIVPVSVSDKKLIVTNQNAVGQMLSFALRFTGNVSGGGYPPYVYDPKIVNGGDPPLGENDDDRSADEDD